MKRKAELQKSNVKKIKNEETIHPISLVFNYIDDPYTFYDASLVCKEWQRVLDTHIFWKNLIEHLGFEEPKPKSRKYKTHKSIFVKNIKKTYEKCRKNIGKENKDLFEIYKKLSILSYYSFNRYEFYEKQLYSEFCRFTKDELEKLYKQSEHDNFIL